jgi:signal peptidase I
MSPPANESVVATASERGSGRAEPVQDDASARRSLLSEATSNGFAPTSGSAARSAAMPRSPAFPLRPSESAVPRVSHRREQHDGRWIGQALLTAGKLALLTFIAYGLMFNFSVVRGSSMSPGIHDGDRILVNHLSYLFEDVQRGDIVVLQYPLDPSLDYIKRVIGVPGDEIRIDARGVSVNGMRLEEPYVAMQDAHAELVSRVAPEHFFVMGDNRPHSSDSREFGQVPRENLRGKVDLRIWPPSRAGTLR